MNKKLNTVLFILAASLLNIIIMGVLAIVPLILFWHFFVKTLDQTVVVFISMFIITSSILGTFAIYNVIMKKFSEKVELEKYFDPLFTSLFKRK